MDTVTTIPSTSFLDSPLLHGTPISPNPSPSSTAKRSPAVVGAPLKLGISRVGATKPKQSKSRNGCITCKQKRLKCDETKPTCQQCCRRNVLCEGYKKDFKWRAFEETTLMTKPLLSPKMKKSPTCAKIMMHRPGSPTASEASGSTASIDFAFSQSTYELPPPSMYQSQTRFQPEPTRKLFNHYPPNHPHYISHPHHTTPLSFLRSSQPVSPCSTSDSIFDEGTSLHVTPTIRPNFTSGQSPRLIDLLLPGTDLHATPPEFKKYNAAQSKIPYQPGGCSYVQEDSMAPLAEDVEDIIRQPEPTEVGVMQLPLLSPTPSNSSTSSEGSRLNAPGFISGQPRFHPGSSEMLMMRFDQQTCGILSVKDGPTENPWRTMLWPLAQDSPALYHAISSMTAFHTSKEQPQLRVAGMEHMRKSIRYLADGIRTMRTETALATTLVLAFSESWDQHISSGTEHLRGARILVNQALTRHRQHPLQEKDLERVKFLCNTWVYMDVIARLTSIDEDDTGGFSTGLTQSYGPPTSHHHVDPLMGCASTLFPLIGRVANLIRKVRTSSTNSFNIISQANELKVLLEKWHVPWEFEAPEDPTSEIQHSLQTAEAYRWATLLYLHQAVPEIPSPSAAQLADKVLVYLATVPLTSRTIIVQIYPLLAAGCEASNDEDRTWVKDRWTAMMRRMMIGNLDRCLEVIKEVWDRRDLDELVRNQARYRQDDSRMQDSRLAGPHSNKRKFKREDGCYLDYESDDGLEWVKRRARGEMMWSEREMGQRECYPRKKSTDMLEAIDFQRTVRGRLHWIGVMRDWKWEVLLG